MPTATRRQFLRASTLAAAGAALPSCQQGNSKTASEDPVPGIVDVHQHPNYLDRTDPQLVRHQQCMGVLQTVLLPSAPPVERPSTHNGKSNGLAAGVGGTDMCRAIVDAHPGAYTYFANEVPDLPGCQASLERQLKEGAIGIGEQKFNLACDSKPIELVAEVAREFDVPVLLHFQHGSYNTGFEKFHRVLEKFPTVTFIGHAQTWWGHIDKNHQPKVLYPKGPVTTGGLTDRYLADYPNMFGDLSAGSGRNSLTRDEDHARGFLARHHEKLLYGSDCPDTLGSGKKCIGADTLTILARLVDDRRALENILGRNARRILRLPKPEAG